MDEEAFDEIWQRYTTGEFTPAPEEEKSCSYARHFGRWAEGPYQEEARSPTHIGINQKMLLLTKKYFEGRAAVPKRHRDRVGERSHVCIFHIFERFYQRYMVLELSLTPPMLFLPPPPPPPPAPPPPPPPPILGITLGEVLGDE